jgi:hypothetical protein
VGVIKLADQEKMALLQKELDYYKAHGEELLQQHQGKFVLIKDQKLLGVFDTDLAAYQEGIAKLGNTIFLIKMVTKEEPVQQIPALTLGILNAHF